MKKQQKKTITICSSASFYPYVLEVQKRLRRLGFRVLVPTTATRMGKSGNFTIEQHKTWYNNPHDYTKKRKLMDGHFKKVRQADAILVINNIRKGIDGYIGGNTLMEMALAYFSHIPIFVWNNTDNSNPFQEEIIGMGSIMIDQDLTKITL